MDGLIHAHIDSFLANGCERIAPNLTIPFCTMCSGGEVVVVILLTLQRNLNKMGINVNFKHMFSCENDQNKIKWITQLIDEDIGKL